MRDNLCVFVHHLLWQCWEARIQETNWAKPCPFKTALNKQQSWVEKNICSACDSTETRNIARSLHLGVTIEIEGNLPITIGDHAQFRIFIDPEDGTSNTARWAECENRAIGESVATVISVAPNKEALKFGDFLIGAALDLRNGQTWLAVKDGGVTTNNLRFSSLPRLVIRRPQHDKHSLLIACEFFRYCSWMMRYLINHNVEFADTASSFINILRAVLGEADIFFNNPLAVTTKIGDQDVMEGQRGHELGAISVFAQELGAYAVDAQTRKPLSESLFTFDGMTPVVVAVNQETYTYYEKLMAENLAVPELWETLMKLHGMLGVQRWSLRPLPQPEPAA